MRTTIRIDDSLLAEAKRRAAGAGTTLTKLIEDALREALARRPPPKRERVGLPTFGGRGLRPGVDINESAALRDVMDGLS